MMNEPIQQTAPEVLPKNDNFPAPFIARKREGLCALLMFIPAYLYVSDCYLPWHLAVIAALLILITELLNAGKKRSAESLVWLGCFILCTAALVFRTGTVWEREQIFFFIHVFSVWWILSRSGRLLEGKSGSFLPVDAFNGFILIPFSFFFLRIRVLAYNLKHLLPERAPEARKRALWLIPAAVLCVLLFSVSVSLLMRADTSFGDLLRSFFGRIRFEPDGEAVMTVLLSLPVGAWLFGLMGGSARWTEEEPEKRRNAVSAFLGRIRKIPVGFWIGVVGLFSLLYVGFFILQGTYLFGAFSRTLPEGFIVSRYAREGFFELCKVMTVNFTVLWLVTRTASAENRGLTAVCLTMLLESMLFAVIAFSKLYLYISCFGFTPMRLRSVWLILMLFAGCALWAYALLTRKPVFRKWMFLVGVSLSVLTLF